MTVQSDDYVRATARMSFGLAASVQNVFAFKLIGSALGDTVAMQDLAEELDDWYTCINPQIVDNQTYVDIDGFNLTQDSPLPETSWPSKTVGGSASDPTPSGAAALVTFRTNFSRRRGRKFLGVMGEGNIGANGQWNTTLMTNLATFGAQLLDPFVGQVSGETWLPVIWSVLKAGMLPTEAVVSAIPAYQRRRRIGTGI